eukprot:g4694.t1
MVSVLAVSAAAVIARTFKGAKAEGDGMLSPGGGKGGGPRNLGKEQPELLRDVEALVEAGKVKPEVLEKLRRESQKEVRSPISPTAQKDMDMIDWGDDDDDYGDNVHPSYRVPTSSTKEDAGRRSAERRRRSADRRRRNKSSKKSTNKKDPMRKRSWFSRKKDLGIAPGIADLSLGEKLSPNDRLSRLREVEELVRIGKVKPEVLEALRVQEEAKSRQYSGGKDRWNAVGDLLHMDRVQSENSEGSDAEATEYYTTSEEENEEEANIQQNGMMKSGHGSEMALAAAKAAAARQRRSTTGGFVRRHRRQSSTEIAAAAAGARQRRSTAHPANASRRLDFQVPNAPPLPQRYENAVQLHEAKSVPKMKLEQKTKLVSTKSAPALKSTTSASAGPPPAIPPKLPPRNIRRNNSVSIHRNVSKSKGKTTALNATPVKPKATPTINKPSPVRPKALKPSKPTAPKPSKPTAPKPSKPTAPKPTPVKMKSKNNVLVQRQVRAQPEKIKNVSERPNSTKRLSSVKSEPILKKNILKEKKNVLKNDKKKSPKSPVRSNPKLFGGVKKLKMKSFKASAKGAMKGSKGKARFVSGSIVTAKKGSQEGKQGTLIEYDEGAKKWLVQWPNLRKLYQEKNLMLKPGSFARKKK